MTLNDDGEWRKAEGKPELLVEKPVKFASDSSSSGARPINQRPANGAEDLFVGREKDKTLVGDGLVADGHRKFAEITFNQFGLHSQFAFQLGRHPGGPGFERRSGFAVTDDHALHTAP